MEVVEVVMAVSKEINELVNAYCRLRDRQHAVYTPHLQVYGKGGEPCPVCEDTLQRIVLGGRGAVFCPHCQK